jgi:hypothetical protein
MKISIRGVFVGGVVDIVLSVACWTAFSSYEISKIVPSQRIGRHWADPMIAAGHTNLLLHLAYLVCSMVGGYLAAMIAKGHEHLNGALASWLRVGFGILGMLIEPRWLDAFMLVAGPLCAFMGGDLRLRVRPTIAEYNTSAESSGNWSSLERSLRSQRPEPIGRVDARIEAGFAPGTLSGGVPGKYYALVGLALTLDVLAGVLFWMWCPNSEIGSMGLVAIFAGLWLIRRALDIKRDARKQLGELPNMFGE